MLMIHELTGIKNHFSKEPIPLSLIVLDGIE